MNVNSHIRIWYYQMFSFYQYYTPYIWCLPSNNDDLEQLKKKRRATKKSFKGHMDAKHGNYWWWGGWCFMKFEEGITNKPNHPKLSLFCSLKNYVKWRFGYLGQVFQGFSLTSMSHIFEMWKTFTLLYVATCFQEHWNSYEFILMILIITLLLD